MDCVGLVVVSLELSQTLTPEEIAAIPRDYPPNPDGSLLAALHAHCVRVANAAVQPADLLALKYQDQPQHLVIVERVAPNGMMAIHAVPDGGVVRHWLDHNYLKSHNATLHAVFRLKTFLPVN